MKNDCYILAEVRFYAGERAELPAAGYRPDAVFRENPSAEYWGITFTDLSMTKFDSPTLAEIRFTFDASHYDQVAEGQSFQIMEGARQVGEGKILHIECKPLLNEC